MLGTAAVSFTKWHLDRPPTWVGGDNYQALFTTDPFFFDSVVATLYFALAATVARVMVAFFVAMLLNRDVKGRAVFRTIYYLPSIVPVVASSMIWIWCFSPDFGLFNAMLKGLGLPTLRWIHGPDTVNPSLVLMEVWAAGPTMIIFSPGFRVCRGNCRMSSKSTAALSCRAVW